MSLEKIPVPGRGSLATISTIATIGAFTAESAIAQPSNPVDERGQETHQFYTPAHQVGISAVKICIPHNFFTARPKCAPLKITKELLQHTTVEPAHQKPKTHHPKKEPYGIWDELAKCESTSRWNLDSGNGFLGGIQFTVKSWHMVGGKGLPNNATRSEQIRRGKKLKVIQGWGAWPACSKKLGLR